MVVFVYFVYSISHYFKNSIQKEVYKIKVYSSNCYKVLKLDWSTLLKGWSSQN